MNLHGVPKKKFAIGSVMNMNAKKHTVRPFMKMNAKAHTVRLMNMKATLTRRRIAKITRALDDLPALRRAGIDPLLVQAEENELKAIIARLETKLECGSASRPEKDRVHDH
jgi:hypothetical protein